MKTPGKGLIAHMPAVPYSRYLFASLPWYSFLIALGAALAVFLASREEKRVSLKKDTIIDLALWLLPFGIIGARIYYVAFAWDQFRGDPISILKIWEGGIAIYGGVIAGFLVILLFCRKRGIPVFLICDLTAPGLVLAQSIGRWGNYFNMEAYGQVIADPALQFFPFGVLIQESSGYVWHMAAFFYESLWNFLVFVFLMAARRKLFRRQGDVFLFYLFLYSCGRLVIEDCRTDSLYAGSSVRISQLLSVILCISILAVYLFRRIRNDERIPLLPVCFSLFSGVYSVPVLLYSLNLFIHPSAMPIGERMLFLAGFSLLSIFALLIIYGKTTEGDVIYAIRKIEKPDV